MKLHPPRGLNDAAACPYRRCSGNRSTRDVSPLLLPLALFPSTAAAGRGDIVNDDDVAEPKVADECRECRRLQQQQHQQQQRRCRRAVDKQCETLFFCGSMHAPHNTSAASRDDDNDDDDNDGDDDDVDDDDEDDPSSFCRCRIPFCRPLSQLPPPSLAVDDVDGIVDAMPSSRYDVTTAACPPASDRFHQQRQRQQQRLRNKRPVTSSLQRSYYDFRSICSGCRQHRGATSSSSNRCDQHLSIEPLTDVIGGRRRRGGSSDFVRRVADVCCCFRRSSDRNAGGGCVDNVGEPGTAKRRTPDARISSAAVGVDDPMMIGEGTLLDGQDFEDGTSGSAVVSGTTDDGDGRQLRAKTRTGERVRHCRRKKVYVIVSCALFVVVVGVAGVIVGSVIVSPFLAASREYKIIETIRRSTSGGERDASRNTLAETFTESVG